MTASRIADLSSAIAIDHIWGSVVTGGLLGLPGLAVG